MQLDAKEAALQMSEIKIPRRDAHEVVTLLVDCAQKCKGAGKPLCLLA